jgi:sugar lactone lactonase YvrE
LGIYDLSTGKPINYVDLAPLAAGPHLLNGIAVDSAGNGYVTDSFSPIIYKIDAQGNATVFLKDEQFAGEGINLNGLVVHPDGYLLVIKKSDGVLFKVPLAQPAQFSKVSINERFVGGDGVTLVGKKNLVLIANQTPAKASNAAYSLTRTNSGASSPSS